jgi:uncharacterized damage-inducible protein DinB
MKIADVLLADFDHEIANCRRILERIPEDNADWKPHEKSMPIGRLALHVATLPRFGTAILSTPGMDMATVKMPPLVFESTAHLLSELDLHAGTTRKALTESTDEALQALWKFSFGEKVILEAPRLVVYRSMYFNHQLHHRGQLNVYLRLLDIPIPALYGPSADDRMGF